MQNGAPLTTHGFAVFQILNFQKLEDHLKNIFTDVLDRLHAADTRHTAAHFAGLTLGLIKTRKTNSVK
jgi:hypothetical protein